MSDSAASAATNTSPAADSSAPREQANPSAPQEAKAPAKQRQLVDLGDEKVDLDQLKREREKWRKADQAFREAAQIRETNQQFMQRLEQDPESVLSDPRLSKKKRELAEKWLLEELQASVTPQDPKDAELSQLRQQLKEFQDQAEQQRQQEEQTKYQQVVAQRRDAIGATLAKALEMTPFSKEPKVQAETIAEMAKYMRICRKAGYEVSPEELASHVQDLRLTSFRGLVSHLEGEELISTLGDDLAKKLQKAFLARIRSRKQSEAPKIDESFQASAGADQPRKFVDPYSVRGGR